MLYALLLLVFLIEIVRGFVRVAVYFDEWLQRGRSIDEEDLEPAVRAMVESDDALEREMARAAGKRGLARVFARWQAKSEAIDEYLDNMHLGWYQVIIIFFVGCMGGLLLEEIWMLATAGLTENRVGLVWGPFSPLYGFGAAFLTAICFQMRRRGARMWQVFFISAGIGGALEQVTGWGMEALFSAESWTYLYLPDHITQWVAWRFLFFWGLLGIVWTRLVMPRLLYQIGMPTSQRQVVFVVLVSAYLVLDIGMTLACFGRKAARDAGMPAQNAFEQWVDTNYTDEFIAGRFENLKIGDERDPK
ncbi:putative ABC transporter permease [Paratractidigestivibacter sp.]|uniref:putative ABC transporter permease n=1 Tax=Paratractidigestivibacter sp. TaxID=2847316 RepID=UPI002AC8EF7A|nr:putative ABC transporter permease [Paratractidigestivibacter sp.]